MRKNCAKPVDGMGTVQLDEHKLYPALTHSPAQHVAKPAVFHRNMHTVSQKLSTIKKSLFYLLSTDLSTLYTGLITKTINI
jgi:hypothetical protein